MYYLFYIWLIVWYDYCSFNYMTYQKVIFCTSLVQKSRQTQTNVSNFLEAQAEYRICYLELLKVKKNH